MSVWHDFFHHLIQLRTPRIRKIRNLADLQRLAPVSGKMAVTVGHTTGVWGPSHTTSSLRHIPLKEDCLCQNPGHVATITWERSFMWIILRILIPLLSFIYYIWGLQSFVSMCLKFQLTFISILNAGRLPWWELYRRVTFPMYNLDPGNVPIMNLDSWSL